MERKVIKGFYKEQEPEVPKKEQDQINEQNIDDSIDVTWIMYGLIGISVVNFILAIILLAK